MTHEPVELVIFDCDGVLVDSERLCLRVDTQVFAELGCHFTEEEMIETFVGSSAEIYDRALEERLGRPLEPGWNKPYDHLYQRAFETELTAIDGAADALEALDLPFCIASNCGHHSLRRNLRTTGLLHHFADGHIFSAEDVDRGKPAPDVFLHAARTMGVAPARCVVVEDSPYGVTAARAAGMRVFGYAGGLTAAHRLAGPGTVVFEDMRELPGLLAGRAVS
ncbi:MULTISPECIES: HAD family hydrolase [unclassified Streptomyces]|uniref:HAD family hydrolase n=1 Tax=unclassified Streptomyces TaxID=2593676 RepID=UPI002E2DC24F|nr:HAD family hydrolase [Streptomyces sp. NBC_01429]